MAGKPWLKLWTETRHDRKLTRVPKAWRWDWTSLMLMAAEYDDGGLLMLSKDVPYSDQDIAAELEVTLDEWARERDYFASMNMLERDGAAYRLTNYVKRQRSADPTGAKRQQTWRERHVTIDSNALRNALPVPLQSRVEAEAEAELTTTTGARAATPLDDWIVAGTAKLEQTCGLFITSRMMADEVTDILTDLYNKNVTNWLDMAIKAASSNNARKWAYVKAVLERCLRDGTAPDVKPPKVETARPGRNGSGKRMSAAMAAGLRAAEAAED